MQTVCVIPACALVVSARSWTGRAIAPIWIAQPDPRTLADAGDAVRPPR